MARIRYHIILPWLLVALLVVWQAVTLRAQSGLQRGAEIIPANLNVSNAAIPAASRPLDASAASSLSSQPFAWTESEAREKLAELLRKTLNGGLEEMPVDGYYQYASYLTEDEGARLRKALSALVPPPKMILVLDYLSDERRITEAQARAALVETLGAERTEEVLTRSRFDGDMRIGKEARLYGAVLQEELGLSPEQRQGLEQIIVEQSRGPSPGKQGQPVPYQEQQAHEQRLYEQVRALLNPGQLERYKDLIKKSDYMEFDPSVSLPQPPFEDEDDGHSSEGDPEAAP